MNDELIKLIKELNKFVKIFKSKEKISFDDRMELEEFILLLEKYKVLENE